MARKTVVTLVDDIDGSEAAETVTFSVDGTKYEIDLSKTNAKAFRRAVKPYVDAGRKSQSKAPRKPAADGTSSREVRAWAVENGVEVPAYGRIPASVKEKFLASKK